MMRVNATDVRELLSQATVLTFQRGTSLTRITLRTLYMEATAGPGTIRQSFMRWNSIDGMRPISTPPRDSCSAHSAGVLKTESKLSFWAPSRIPQARGTAFRYLTIEILFFGIMREEYCIT